MPRSSVPFADLTPPPFSGPQAFYMKLNEDGKTVAAMDVLVPKVGAPRGRAAACLPACLRARALLCPRHPPTHPACHPATHPPTAHAQLACRVQVGELIGGSQREDRLDVLEARIKENGMPLEAYGGYLDLRRYGTVPHSGAGSLRAMLRCILRCMLRSALCSARLWEEGVGGEGPFCLFCRGRREGERAAALPCGRLNACPEDACVLMPWNVGRHSRGLSGQP